MKFFKDFNKEILHATKNEILFSGMLFFNRSLLK